MTIDFKNNRIYHFDKALKLKEHRPISADFKEIEVLHDGRLLIIEDYNKYENGEKSNLYCLNQNLEIEWFLPFPGDNIDGMQNYVGFTTNGDNVFANTFSCIRVEIDINNGSIKSRAFTK